MKAFIDEKVKNAYFTIINNIYIRQLIYKHYSDKFQNQKNFSLLIFKLQSYLFNDVESQIILKLFIFNKILV